MNSISINTQHPALDILHYQRKKRAFGNHSLEFIFHDVRHRLSKRCRIEARFAPHESSGIMSRIGTIRDVRRCYSKHRITHVTGDVNYAIMGTPWKSSILTLLDCGFLRFDGFFKRATLKLFWLDLPTRWAHIVTTISQQVKDEIVSLTGCNPAKVLVIPVAISDKFSRDAKDFKTDKPRILQVGTAPNKNLIRLADAIANINCTLCIVGEIQPDLLLQLRNRSICFENFTDLSQDEVIYQYKRADLVSFASVYEGLGMPILEAQSVGRPVVTSNLSSMPEVAGDAACFVDPYDVKSIRAGIQRVIFDEPYRTGLVERGFENVERFNPEVIANQYFALYQSVADELHIKHR